MRLNEKGVMFLEIMISITILTFVGVAALKAFVLGNELSRINMHKTVAMQFAQTRIEDVKSDNFTNVTALNYPPDTVTLDTNNTTGNNADDVIANRLVGIFSNPGDGGATKYITVEVTWVWQNHTFSESLNTIIGN